MWFILVCIGILLGYFFLRFGMVSRGMARQYIQSIGGIILTVMFILAFLFFGWKKGALSILIFWFIATPVVELLISRIDKKINEPYKDVHKYLAKKYNITSDEVKKQIYKNMDNPF